MTTIKQLTEDLEGRNRNLDNIILKLKLELNETTQKLETEIKTYEETIDENNETIKILQRLGDKS